MIPRSAPNMDEGIIVLAKDVKYVYDGGVLALKGVNLRVRSGEYIAIVGGNGSGKTTLAKNLNGLLRPSSGSIRIAGRSTTDMTVAQLARFVGYAFQNPDHQLFSSTVEGEVRFGPVNLGYSEDEVDKKVDHALEIMGLEEVRGSPPLSLTLGHRRKISIASVIAMDPQVMILDEPTTGLDAEQVKELMGNIASLNREGRTLILITHDMRLVAENARRVLMMSEGQVVLDSDPRGAFSDTELLKQCNLEPPPVTLLAHRLSDLGFARDTISSEEIASQVLKLTRRS